jgi:hypothetical protein
MAETTSQFYVYEDRTVHTTTVHYGECRAPGLRLLHGVTILARINHARGVRGQEG